MSMITNVYFVPTLLGALGNTYATGSYVRTLGFAEAGDGGAAMYKISSETVSGASSYTIAGTPFNYGGGKFYTSSSAVFQFLPSNGKVYAEQFGVLPDNDSLASTNVNLLSKAVDYVTSKGYTLTFASKGTYYLAPITITVPSNLFLDGNGATLHVIGGTDGGIGLFDSSSQVDNISIKNITLIGRKTSVSSTQNDQAIHIKSTNLSVQNVSFKFFDYAFHTYAPTEYADYAIPSIPNKNWLIENCKTESCIFGLNTSEIDGLVIKDSDISCYLNSNDMAHCVYLSSNCSNVRVTGCNLHNVSGDAIHKAYAVPDSNPKGDASKNHFYTDLSIHDADSALLFGIVSENVMCDNAFATDVKIALQLAGADNCIISNSHLEQTQQSSETEAFIYAEEACNCWLQNSYVYYTGRHRKTTSQPKAHYVSRMFEDKKHRRMFIGEDFKTPNHWFKFTGCEFVSANETADYYFYEDVNNVVNGSDNPQKSQFGEFWDNSSLTTYIKDACLWHMYCINDLPGGLTIRNSYINAKNGTPKAPFRYCCWTKNCTDENNVCAMNKYCIHAKFGKYFPWLHLENSMFKGMTSGYNNSNWYYIITYGDSLKNFTQEEATKKAIKLSNSYGINCYKLDNKTYKQLNLN